MALTTNDPLLSGLGRFQAQQGAYSISSTSTKDIAQGFESLLIRQFLAASRTGLLEEPEQKESGWMEMADDALAGYLASQGGLGLSRQVASLLEQGAKRGESLSSASSALNRVRVDTEDQVASSSSSSPFLNISSDSAVFKESGLSSDSITSGAKPALQAEMGVKK